MLFMQPKHFHLYGQKEHKPNCPYVKEAKIHEKKIKKLLKE